MMMKESWNHIARYFSKEELIETEKEYISNALTDDQLKNTLDGTETMLKKVDLYFDLKKIDSRSAWNKLNHQLERPTKKYSIPARFLRIAAIFLFIVAAGFATWKLVNNNKTTTFSTAQTDFSHPVIVLPDGSKVTLNYGSQLIFPDNFNGEAREVKLKGEAFFEVTPNAEKPFIVKTKNASIKVLGTSFNVLSYDSNETVEIYVKTGKVEVKEEGTELASTNKMVLMPGEKGTFNTATLSLTKNNAEKGNHLAWLTHEIEFQFTGLNEVIKTLEHAYNLKIEINGDVDLDQKITATFNRQNPDYILEVVAITLDLNLTKTSQNAYLINHK